MGRVCKEENTRERERRREREKREKQLNIISLQAPLEATFKCVWVRDHIRKIIDRQRGEEEEKEEKKKVWRLLKMEFKGSTAFPFSPLLPIALLPLTARVSSRDDVKQISNASV